MEPRFVLEMTEALLPLLAIPSVAEHGREGLPYGPGPAQALRCVLELCERRPPENLFGVDTGFCCLQYKSRGKE